MMSKVDMKSIIFDLIKQELVQANKKFPMFQSPHEGWAVMLEEKKEADSIIEKIGIDMRVLFDLYIMVNDVEGGIDRAKAIKAKSVDMICEIVQLAAMAQKYVDSLSGR